MNSRDKNIVLKMIRYCNEIKKTHDYFQYSKDIFLNKQEGFIYRNSITMPILQIGELAKHLSDDFLTEHPEIQWRQIKGIRDIFAHHYSSVDFTFVWQTAHEDIDVLMKILEKAVADS